MEWNGNSCCLVGLFLVLLQASRATYTEQAEIVSSMGRQVLSTNRNDMGHSWGKSGRVRVQRFALGLLSSR